MFRRLRAAFGNALIWGLAWFVGSSVLGVVALLLGAFPSVGIITLSSFLRGTVGFGITGFLVGGAFSGILRMAYRDQGLLKINAPLFGLGGAVVAGVLAPFLGGSAVIGAALGAVTAFATIRIAQKSERRLLDASDGDAYLTGEVV